MQHTNRPSLFSGPFKDGQGLRPRLPGQIPPMQRTDPATGRPVPNDWDSSVPGWGPYTQEGYQRAVEQRRNPTGPSISGTGGISNLLSRISEGEGTSDAVARENGFDTSYDVPLGYGRYAVPSKPVSQMTLGEIDELQSEMLSNPENDLNSSALGRYQITRTTLRSLKRQFGLSDDTLFDAELQDRLATALLEGRGLARYLGGEMSEQEFQRELAKEWASIANPDTGRALQHTGTTNEEIGAVLQQMRGR